MSARFDIAYDITRRIEGGWHGATGANAADRGGETFKGIARKHWPNWHGWKVVDALKREPGFPRTAETDPILSRMVREFYQTHFWDNIRLGQLHSQAIANELFDTSVNVGSRVAARWLQQGLNALNRNQRNWPDLRVDGIVGMMTINTTNQLSAQDTAHLFDVLNIIQGDYYLKLTQSDPTQEVFLRGWLERVQMMK